MEKSSESGQQAADRIDAHKMLSARKENLRGFVSGGFHVQADVKFLIKSPLETIKRWIRKIAA